MPVKEVGALYKEAEMMRSATIASATTTAGNSIDISGATGRALVIWSVDAVGGTADLKFQQADDTGFSANVSEFGIAGTPDDPVRVKTVGSNTEAAFTQVAAGAGSFQVRSIELGGLRKFIRARMVSGASTTATKNCVAIILPGYNSLVSGGPTF